MDMKIRDAVPSDAGAIQRIIATGYKRSFAELHTPEYLNNKIQEYLSDARIAKMADIIRDKNSINIVAINDNDDVVGSIGGCKNESGDWELIALYVDERVIGDTKFALNLAKEFARRVKATGANKFITQTLTGSRVCRLYELLGGKKIKEFVDENRDHVLETMFEFDIKRFV